MSLDITVTAIAPTVVFDANLTHNLTEMAEFVGLYMVMWRPEECGIKTCADALTPLREGLHRLKTQESECRAMNPSNGWGTYEGLLKVTEDYIKVCEKHPEGKIDAYR